MTDLDVFMRCEGDVCQGKARDEVCSSSPAAFACFFTGDDVHLLFPATTGALMSLPPLPPVIGSLVQPGTTWISARPMPPLAALLLVCSSNLIQMEREEFVPQRVFGGDAGNVTCYIKQTMPPSWCFIDLQYKRCFLKPLLDLLWQSCDAYLTATWTPSIPSRNLADPYFVHFVHKMRRRNLEVWLFIHDVRRKMHLAALDVRLRAKDFLHMLHCEKKKC